MQLLQTSTSIKHLQVQKNYVVDMEEYRYVIRWL